MSVKLRRAIGFKLYPRPIFDEEAVLEVFDEYGVKPVHAISMWRYLLRTPGASLDNMLEWASTVHIPLKIVPPLQRDFTMLTSFVEQAQTSSDGAVTKLLITLQDGLKIEAVVIRNGATTARRLKGENRTTVCVSSQVGCKMGCKFCATGTMGEIANLSMGEILEQLVHARVHSSVHNVVFMGMGEPLNNYSNVVAAVRAMVDPRLFQLAHQRVTVSTVGVVPKMHQFMSDLPSVSLALSLHAPEQKLRESFVPSGKQFSLAALMEVVDAYIDTGRKMLLEYCLLRGVNDSEDVAHALGRLLQGRKVLLNVIPYNPTDVDMGYSAPTREGLLKFISILKSYNLLAVVRREMGQEISGACGQLVVEKKHQKNAQSGIVCDVEDLAGTAADTAKHTPGGSEEDCKPSKRALWPDMALSLDPRRAQMPKKQPKPNCKSQKDGDGRQGGIEVWHSSKGPNLLDSSQTSGLKQLQKQLSQCAADAAEFPNDSDCAEERTVCGLSALQWALVFAGVAVQGAVGVAFYLN
eukprot:CAMPEP_0175128592 /NCGR_PEP_ID=MMETSP0087-20121206/5011_1 /TAXON_ID=136419 /ORGANISM="Unknown Unknown, Strain D1" /LENGTH=522 /DNA_ID=CAMNT_0016410665 /DNA_START=44 /DNA_END=1612 /DNA_ORIENTATION=+